MAPIKGTFAICANCGRLVKMCARGLCNTCYDKDVRTRKIRKCHQCGKVRPHHSHGLCDNCSRKEAYHSNRDREINNQRARYQKNKERNTNRDRARNKTPYRRAWQQKRNQEYYAANKSAIYEYQKRYKETHPGYVSHHTQKYYAKKAGLPHDLTQEQWIEILEQHNHACHYCGRTDVKLQREHKIPVSRGGGFTVSNIVPACRSCNMRKHDRTDSEFFEFLKQFPRE